MTSIRRRPPKPGSTGPAGATTGKPVTKPGGSTKPVQKPKPRPTRPGGKPKPGSKPAPTKPGGKRPGIGRPAPTKPGGKRPGIGRPAPTKPGGKRPGLLNLAVSVLHLLSPAVSVLDMAYPRPLMWNW